VKLRKFVHTKINLEDFLNTYKQGTQKFQNLYLSSDTHLSNLFLSSIELINAELFGVAFSSIVIENTNLSNSNLCWCKFKDTQIRRCNLHGTYLRGIVMTDTSLDEVDLTESNLIDANLQFVSLKNVNFSNARYSTGTVFPEKFSPTQEGMIFVDPKSEALDNLLKVPFVEKFNRKYSFSDISEETYDENDSIKIVLTRLLKSLESPKENQFKLLNHNDLMDDYEEMEFYIFSHFKAFGKYINLEYWLDGVPSSFIRGKIPGNWTVFYSREFLKSTFNLDEDLKQAILEAEDCIRSAPLTPFGNTIKPLSGREFRGLWRYRIGDMRMIYYPDKETRNILIITISSRGKVYSRVQSFKEYREKLHQLTT
jgi:mRNA-degrading endonuclease RelE of RelBE toxin-antitoxin system